MVDPERNNIKIVIVEDEGIVAKDIQRMLDNLGYCTAGVASSGEGAIRMAKEIRPDLVLMDIRLKGDMDGIDAAHEIRSARDIPVVFLSAHSDEKTLQRAKASKPFGYVLKPVEVRELHTTIEIALYRHNLEQKLKKSEVWLSTILQCISGAVVATDVNGCIMFMNTTAAALTGWTQKEALGIRAAEVFRIVDEFSHTALENPVARVLSGGTVVEGANQVLLIARDESETTIEHSVAPIKDKDGTIIGVVLVFRNVTGRRQAEKALRAELESKNAELERFTYTVSHDLKSPLVTIRGFLGLLEKDVEKGDFEQLRSDIARIAHAADKMLQLLAEILDLSRIGRVVNKPENVSLADISREAVELVAVQIAERGVEVAISPHLPVVYGDRPRLLEVMQNLIDNAVKFMGGQEKPRIEIGAEEREGEYVCFVRDNGIGIEPSYREGVFGLFDKLDAHSEGSGIGLALVKRILEVHGGKIWIEPGGGGKGSTFYFTLPKNGGIENDGHRS